MDVGFKQCQCGYHYRAFNLSFKTPPIPNGEEGKEGHYLLPTPDALILAMPNEAPLNLESGLSL